MNVTYKMLEKIKACKEGLEWFEEMYGEDGEVTWDQLISDCPEKEWLAWFGVECPAEVEGSTWQARLDLQQDTDECACFARYCPAGVEGATWEARLALQQDKFDRAWLGQDCPVGVEGATLDARLVVQIRDGGRYYVLHTFGPKENS